MSKFFVVVARSANTNSFGLYSNLLLHPDSGEVWKVLANSINVRDVGDTIFVDSNAFHLHGFEVPRQLPSINNKKFVSKWIRDSFTAFNERLQHASRADG